MLPETQQNKYWSYIVLMLAVLFLIGLMADGAFAGVSATPPGQGETGKSNQPSDPPGKLPLGATPTPACPATTPLSEGFESGTLGVFASSVATCVPGGCGWTSVTTAAHTGTRSAFAPDVSNISDQRLTSLTPVAIPAGATAATLNFWHRYTFEGSGTDYYDGGVLEVSTNSGTSWLTPTFTLGGYTGVINSSFQNPLAGRQAWTLTTGTSFTQVTANLLPYAGQSVIFRFREGTDSSVAATGWWVDDVTVVIRVCSTTPTVTGTHPTSTPTATGVACGVVYTGSITGSDPTQTNRLFRDGVQDTCAVPGACGSPFPGTFHYDTYTFTNTTGASACITVALNTTCTGTNFIFSGTYLGSFNPANICTNFLADMGLSPNPTESYSFTVPAGATFVINVHEVTANAGCPSYTMTVSGLAGPMNFSDVHPNDWFYEFVQCLYCRGAISGYSDGTFRPNANTTRGQLTKIVVLGFNIATYMPPSPTFVDVPTTYAFYQYIETAYHNSLISGYSCGAGCLEFRPGNLVTRAQLSKIVVIAAAWSLINPTTATFRDVPTTNTFYSYVETAYCHQIISGYTCGTGCLEFRPGNSATRAQISKIVCLAVRNQGVCIPPPSSTNN